MHFVSNDLCIFSFSNVNIDMSNVNSNFIPLLLKKNE